MKRGMKKLLCVATALMMVPSVPAFASGLIAENPAAAKTQPVVEVEGGKLIGFTRDDTYCFWGVDYAYADRFEQPQKVEPWEATSLHRAMAQSHTSRIRRLSVQMSLSGRIATGHRAITVRT